MAQNDKNKSPIMGDLRISRPPHNGHVQTVKDHLIETGMIVARNLLTLSHINPSLIPLAEAAGKWHDLGKLDPDWQEYIRREERKKSPGHAEHGAAFAFYHKLYPIAAAILGHHTGLHNWQGGNSLQEKLKKNLKWEKIKTIAESELDADLLTQPKYQFDKNSDELLTRIIFSVLIDSDRESVARFFGQWEDPLRPSLEEISDRFHKYYQQISKQDPRKIINQIRAEIFQASQTSADQPFGFFGLSTPTGGGKTLSVMAFAIKHAIKHQHDRIIYCPPYTSIIEQSADVYRQALGVDAVLEHHSGVIFNNETELTEYEISAQRWDYPIIVTTTVQLFESLFSNHPSQCRKVHRVPNSIIILDEVQVLPLQYWKPIMSMLKELVEKWHCSVVFCTATQPWYEIYENFPSIQDIVPQVQRESHFTTLNRRVLYQYQGKAWTWENLVSDVRKRKLQNALVVVNSKKDAKEGYIALKTLGNVFHLSTNMYAEHRRQVIKQVRERLVNGLPTYLISTQLIEAGVDLDFAWGYRVITGLDSIIQTAGRVNRNFRLRNGKLVIFELIGSHQPNSNQQRISYTKPILLTETDLGAEKNCKQYFKNLFIGQDNIDSQNFDQKNIEKMREDYKFKDVSQAFKMIEEDDKIDVIVAIEDEPLELIQKLQNGQYLSKQEWRKLYQYSVAVKTSLIQSHTRQIIPNVYLWQGNYDNNWGICTH